MTYSCFFGNISYDLPEYRRVILSFYAVTGIPAIVLNSLILYSIWKTPSLHKPSYVLLASLALSDLFNGSFGQYTMVVQNIAALQNWTSTAFCYTWIGGRATSYWLTSVSLYTLAIISIDRLLAIRLKTRYRTFVTMKRIIIILSEFWVQSFVVILIFLFHFKIEGNLSEYLYIVGVCIFIILFTITISYSMAYYYLKKATRSVSPNDGTGNTPAVNSDANMDKYRKSLNTMVLVFVVLILFYLPYVCSATGAAIILSSNEVPRDQELLVYQILATCELMAFVNSTANPIMYLWRIKDIRQAVARVVRRMICHQPMNNTCRIF